MLDVVSFGSIYVDINCTHFPIEKLEPEKEIVGSHYSLDLGGSAVISSAVGASLGLKTAFVGKIGQDAMGEIVANKLEAAGIAPHVITSSQHQTNVSVNYVNDLGRSVMTTLGNANQALTEQDLLATITPLLAQTKILYLGGVFKLKQLASVYPKLLSIAQRNKCQVVLDHGRVTNIVGEQDLALVRAMVKHVHYYIPSEQEALIVWQVDTIQKALRTIAKHAPDARAIITHGPQGAQGLDAFGHTHQTITRDIVPLNTVGAGDTFNAGFMFGILRGMAFGDAMQFAQVAAEHKIETNTYPTAFEITRKLESK
jgi:sugar/nucleoside kinase (ribokinase family)